MKTLIVSNSIGELVRNARRKADMNQVDVARKAKISQAYLSEIENGTEPSITVLRRIATALGVSVHELIPEE